MNADPLDFSHLVAQADELVPGTAELADLIREAGAPFDLDAPVIQPRRDPEFEQALSAFVADEFRLRRESSRRLLLVSGSAATPWTKAMQDAYERRQWLAKTRRKSPPPYRGGRGWRVTVRRRRRS